MNAPENQRFPKSLRLTKRLEFDQVFRIGRVAADDVLVVHAIRTPTPFLRIGISISKRVGNAPTRNRWKRLIREVFRTQRASLPNWIDMVVRPKRGANPDFLAIQRSLPNLVRRLDRQLNKR